MVLSCSFYVSVRHSNPYPIGSMGLVYLPTFTTRINHSCRYIYHSHGSGGYCWFGSYTRKDFRFPSRRLPAGNAWWSSTVGTLRQFLQCPRDDPWKLHRRFFRRIQPRPPLGSMGWWYIDPHSIVFCGTNALSYIFPWTKTVVYIYIHMYFVQCEMIHSTLKKK